MTVPGSASRKPGIIKFLVTYVALMGLFLLLIGYEPIKRVLDIDGLYSRGIVAVTAFFLESAGMAVRTSSTILPDRRSFYYHVRSLALPLFVSHAQLSKGPC